MLKGLSSQRLLALFCAGMVVLNFPLLSLWNVDISVFGLPLFPVALFVFWGLLIATLAWLLERADD